MSAERWRRIGDIYEELLDTPESQRAQRLKELCGADDALASEIAALLQADSAPLPFLAEAVMRVLVDSIQIGDVLCGRFVVLRAIGRGGMGEVWAARDLQLDEEVALKTIAPAVNDEARALIRFKREIQLARRIGHPNVCRVHEVFEDSATTPPRWFLTMELLDGETLAARLKRTGALPPAEALEVVRQVAAGLAAAHAAGVVHRDLKPSNIMLCTGAPHRRSVIMDFGLARSDQPDVTDGASVDGVLMGTPQYLAPEQINGGVATPSTDVYALGLILFEMLRGTAPFAAGSTIESWMRRAREGPERLSGTIEGLHPRVDSAIARCLQYEPGRRFQSAREVADAVMPPRGLRALPVVRGAALAVAAAGISTIVAVMAWPRGEVAPPAPEALRWFDEAQQALAEGASVRALRAITRAIELSPSFAAAHAAHSDTLLELDMPGAAHEAMLRANQAAPNRDRLPDDHVAYIDGMQQLLLRNCDAAIASLQRFAVAAEPAARPYRMVGTARAMERCDQPDAAQRTLAEVARLDPRNAAVALRVARLAAARRDYQGAAAALANAEALFRDRNNVEGIGEVLTVRGTLEAEQDRLDDATATLAHADEMARTLQDVRQRVRVLLQQAIVYRKRGDVTAADRLTAAGVELARSNNLEALTVQALFTAGNVHLVRNQYREAQALFDRALTIAETYRHEDFRARGWLSLATVFVRTMEPRRAEEAIASARPHYERIGHTRNLAIADALLGLVRLLRAEYDLAISQFDDEVRSAAAAGDREQETAARENLATALVGAGRYPEAIENYRRALSTHRASARTRNETFTLLNLSDVFSRLGRFDEAVDTLAQARLVAPDGPDIQSRLSFVEAAGALRQGRYDLARTAAERTLRVGTALSAERITGAKLIACGALAHLDLHAQARQMCSDALDEISEDGSVPLWIESRLAAAELDRLVGDRASARRYIQQAAMVFEGLSAHQDRWRFLALSAATAAVGAGELRARLTRELDSLRLNWGQANYEAWKQRPDVSGALAAAGIG